MELIIVVSVLLPFAVVGLFYVGSWIHSKYEQWYDSRETQRFDKIREQCRQDYYFRRIDSLWKIFCSKKDSKSALRYKLRKLCRTIRKNHEQVDKIEAQLLDQLISLSIAHNELVKSHETLKLNLTEKLDVIQELLQSKEALGKNETTPKGSPQVRHPI